MPKIYFIFALLIGLTAGLSNVTAQSTTDASDDSVKRPILNAVKEVREDRAEFKANTVKPIREEIKNDIKTTNQEIKTERKTFIGNATTTLRTVSKEDRPEAIAALKAQREQLQQDIKEKREQLKQEMEEKRESLKEQRQAFQEEARKKIAQSAGERISRTLDNLEAAVNRIIDINGRIETRINKLKEAGENTSEAEASLLNAEEKAGAALTAIEMARAAIAESDSATSTDVLSFKAILKTTQDVAKAAREATSHTIGLVKGLGPKTATTTPENN
ncbi:MAG TPA: hypothetical protein VJI33_03540 [Candidatus Paceibacterota bacterium]